MKESIKVWVNNKCEEVYNSLDMVSLHFIHRFDNAYVYSDELMNPEYIKLEDGRYFIKDISPSLLIVEEIPKGYKPKKTVWYLM